MEFNVTINDDDITENNETFNLVIDDSTLPDDVTLGDYDTAIVTIINDDGKNKLLFVFAKVIEKLWYRLRTCSVSIEAIVHNYSTFYVHTCS